MKHYTFNEKVKILLESVPNINGIEARQIAASTCSWTFIMIEDLEKALHKIAKGK